MGRMTRLFSALLVWVILLGVGAIPAGAADGYELSILKVQTFPAGTTDYHADAATSISAQKGEFVVVTVGFKNSKNATIPISSFKIQLNYDTSKLETYDQNAGATNLFASGRNKVSYEACDNFTLVSDWITSANVKAANPYVVFTGMSEYGADIAAGSSEGIVRFAFRVKSDAADGTASFTIDRNQSYVYDLKDNPDNNAKLTLGASAPFKLTIGASETPIPIVKPGDVDEDGDVTAIDARIALNMASGVIDEIEQTTKQKTAADVDKDGYVTAIDARMILQFASGVLETFD